MSIQETLTTFGKIRTKKLMKTPQFYKICDDIRNKHPHPSLRAPRELSVMAILYTRRIEIEYWEDATEGEVSTLMRAAIAGRLNEYPILMRFLLKEAVVTSLPSLLAAFFEGYLDGWVAESVATKSYAALILRRAADFPEPFRSFLTSCPEILDTADGASRFAERLVKQENAYGWCVMQGLSNPHGHGFSAAMQGVYLSSLPSMDTFEHVQILMRWMLPNLTEPLSGDALPRCLDLLLEPWQLQEPPDQLKRDLVDWMVDNFGDPRTESPKLWGWISPDNLGVLKRWLAGDSIRAFMDVISEVEKRDTWRMRRHFWTTLYEEGTVQEAWVALHPIAEAVALRRETETGDVSYRSFGKQSGSRTSTSLLIMRAGDKIIVEGSHTYRVHVFDEEFPGRPKLYDPVYLDQDITLSRDDKANTNWHDPPGHWRNWVRQRLQ